jgi:ferrous iron transport protein B
LKDATETGQSQQPQLTSKIDKVVTNPILGLPIFAGIFFLMFKLSFDWVGTPLSDLLDWFLSVPVSNTANQLLIQAGAIPALRSLIVNGIIAGVGGVLAFIPQIFTLFACISLLEDSGYMARAALVTDRLMQMIGLNGKSFIPLIIGFGCNVTGIMAARTIEQPKERLVTTLIMPFMSCSARLPIYSLVVAAFFPHHQALIVLSIYFLGVVVALLVAKLYQVLFHVKDRSVFIVELPEYHLPRLDIIWHGTWDKGKGFIKKAGTIIFAGTVLIWLLSSFGPRGFVTDSTASYAASLGHALVPMFKPIGIVQWQAISALFTGVLAKEVITSSMMVMFHTSSKAVLITALGQFMSPVAAYAMLAFVLLYIPCFATLATIKEETGSYKWVFFSVVSSFIIAYVTAFILFQVGSLIF